MKSVVAGLVPELVWQRFLELTTIPRPPKEEDEVRAHVLAWALDRGFETQVDAAGNVVVRVPASPGRAAAPTVVLQAHLDMVCERDPDTPNDPRAGRIELVRDGDWIAAAGTTLGADNGIGVAAALAAAEDAAAAHGPLELLLTVSEEQGLDGAKELDPALVSGRLLVNLDGTSDGALTVGCAGSSHTFTRISLSPEPVPAGWSGLEVRLSGVRGGHSGGDIGTGRVNAIKALGRVLSRAQAVALFRIATLSGGVSRNAIPRDAQATVTVPEAGESDFRRAVEAELADIRAQHAESDPGAVVAIAPAEVHTAASAAVSARVLDLLAALPSGVIAPHPRLAGVVETSTSLNVASTEGATVTLAGMSRSASSYALEDVVRRIEALARLAGATVDVKRSYPPWEPDLDSPLLAAARSTFSRLFDTEPRLDVVHGGLECAVIGAGLPGVQMISIGPTIEGPHAPGERLGIASTERFYRLLVALLDDLSS